MENITMTFTQQEVDSIFKVLQRAQMKSFLDWQNCKITRDTYEETARAYIAFYTEMPD